MSSASPIALPATVSAPRRFDAVAAWFAALCFVLAGYAIMGKGFAYLGAPPMFIGEVLLAGGLVLLLACPAWRKLLDVPVIWWLILLSIWGLAQTLPYLSKYKADALRDAVIFGYGAFTFIVAAWIIARPQLIGTLVQRYQRFVIPFLLLIPVLWLGQQLLQHRLPRWPWSPHVTVLWLKAADVLVHLGGVAALACVGLFPRKSLFWPLLVLLNVAITGVVNRGGLVSFSFVVLLAFCFYPQSTWVRRMVIVGLFATIALAAINPEIKTPNDRRKISFEQLSTNVVSLVSNVNKGDLDGTKRWRLDWWNKIIDYTLFGPYFWTGKGYGVNLANDDGFQVDLEYESLRSPHNGHLTVLARSGVPGMAIWIGLHASFALMMINAIRRATAAGDHLWRSLFVFILAYWCGFMLNASFDVFIEGPMGGVWFWSLIGVGVAAVWVYRHDPAAAGLEGSVQPCV